LRSRRLLHLLKREIKLMKQNLDSAKKSVLSVTCLLLSPFGGFGSTNLQPQPSSFLYLYALTGKLQ
jgi:hypothetical protein